MCIQQRLRDEHLLLTPHNLNFPIFEEAEENLPTTETEEEQEITTVRAERETQTRDPEFQEGDLEFEDIYDAWDDFYGNVEDFYDQVDEFYDDADFDAEIYEEITIPFINNGVSISRINLSELSNEDNNFDLYQMDQVENVQMEFKVETSDLDDIVNEISQFEDSSIVFNSTIYGNHIENQEDDTSSDEETNLAIEYRQLAAELRDARRYTYEYIDIEDEPNPLSQESNNLPTETQGFITASKFLEMTQKAKNENPPPLNEEIVKDNEIVIQIEREHSVEPSQQLIIDDDLEMIHEDTSNDNSDLNQSIQELSRKLSTQNELNESLSSLSQRLNDSEVLAEYVEIAKNSCERMKELEYREAMEKSIKMKEKRLMKSICDHNLSFDTQAYEKCLESSQYVPEPQQLGGFTFASGRTVNVDRNTAKKYEMMFGEGEIFEDEKKTSPEKIETPMEVCNKAYNGFSFASGRTVKVDRNTTKKYERLFGDDDMLEDEKEAIPKKFKTPIEASNKAYNGFSFASGRTLNVNKKVIEQYEKQFEVDKHDNAEEILPRIEVEDLSQITKEISKVESPPSFGGFKFASGSTVAINQAKVNQIKRNFESPTREEVGNAKKFCFEGGEPKTAQKSLVFAPTHASSPVVALQQSSTIESGISLRSFQTRRSTTFESSPSPIVTRRRLVRRVNKENEGFDLDKRSSGTSSTNRQSLLSLSLNIKRKQVVSQRMLFADDDEMNEQEYQHFLEVEKASIEEMKKIEEAKAQLEVARDEQLKYIRDKPASDCRSMQGTLLMMKSAKNRMTLEQYVEHEKPTNRKLHEQNDDFIEFDMKSTTTSGNKIYVILGDNAKVILSNTSTIGIEEIKQGFLSSPGVDPKLLHEKWIENAYLMIVRKFKWMENSFEKFNKFDVLTPNNILLQLKYRYDREIDLHQRPAIRKIVELDEIPQRRVVLKVIDIICTAQNTIELQLSDGWYTIKATIDECLTRAVMKKKISTNDKLIIAGAVLQNNENGFDPLDLPECVRLKIFGNSTRLVNQNTKLGFCKNPWPFLISLDAVCDDGLLVGKLRLHVVQVYSLIFVESNGEKLEYRSERMQARINDRNEIIYSRLLESIFEKTVAQFREKLADRVGELKTLPLDSLSTIDITDILVYEQNSAYGMRLWDHLSHAQRNEVITQRQELNSTLKSKAVCEMESIKSTKTEVMLKFRVVDLKNPNKTALICWYRPNEGILDSIKEGISLELTNLFASKKIGELQLRSHPQGKTSFRILKSTHENSPEKYEPFMRKESLISELKVNEFNPPLNEFDTACIVVRIDDKDEDMGFQNMFVADDEMNFLCIKFLPNINDFAYENFLKEQTIFYIRNLQWRNTSCKMNSSISEAFVIPDSTSFVSNPSKRSQRIRLEEFRLKMGEIQTFYNNCRDKLNELVGSNQITPRLSLEENPYLKRFYSVRQYGKSCAPRRFRFN